MSDYNIHRNKIQFYYIAKALQRFLNSAPTTVYNAPDKLDWRGCCRAAVKYMQANEKYEENNPDTVMGWYWKLREEITLPFPIIRNNAVPPNLQPNREA